MQNVTTPGEPLLVDVGPLTSVQSFCYHVGPGLQKFNELYRRSPSGAMIQWDLSGALPRQVSLVALTTFVATAHRLWKLSGSPQQVQWPRNAALQVFFAATLERVFADIDLFSRKLVVDAGSIDRRRLDTGPLSRIMLLERPPIPDAPDDIDGLKRHYRNGLMGEFLKMCMTLFPDLTELVGQVALTCAELVTNCFLWGRAAAVIGVQRNRAGGITIAICDAGQGFLFSLRQNRQEWLLRTNADALSLASLVNERDHGLRQVTDLITQQGGWVLVSTLDTAITWHREQWTAAKENFRAISELGLRERSLSEITPPHVDRFPAVRGSRVSFELPTRLR